MTAAAEEVERRENSAKRLMKFANTAPSVMQQAKTAVRKNNNKTASSDAAERRDEALDADDEFEDKGNKIVTKPHVCCVVCEARASYR